MLPDNKQTEESLCEFHFCFVCFFSGKGVCHVAADPHYYTFDGEMHTFMGTCTYTLVEVWVTFINLVFST